VKQKRNPSIDDETLENMRRYYKIDDHKELLQYIKKNDIIKGDFEHE
jgi:tRNA A37 methylthiotransferase MiaB